jgi:hypothetical protein
VTPIKPRKCSYIGALCVPGHPEEPRFVFISTHRKPAEQLRAIRRRKRDGSAVSTWLERLNALHLSPAICCLAAVPVAVAQERKAIWVRLLLTDGRCLYNAQLGRRRKPTLYVKALTERIIRERRPVKRRQRTLSTLKNLYKIEIGQREGVRRTHQA